MKMKQPEDEVKGLFSNTDPKYSRLVKEELRCLFKGTEPTQDLELNRELSHKTTTAQLFLSAAGVLAMGLILQKWEMITLGLVLSSLDSKVADVITTSNFINRAQKDVYLYTGAYGGVLEVRDTIRGGLSSFVANIGSYFAEPEEDQAPQVAIEKKNN